MGSLFLLLFAALFLLARASFFAADKYNAELYASGLDGARTLLVDDAGDILVLARSRKQGQIIALYENGNSRMEAIIVNNSSLNLTHGMTVFRGYLYASSDTTVYRWNYTQGQRKMVSGKPDIVVEKMNADGHGGAPQGHQTRTLIIDKDGSYLYISVGSLENVDKNSYRSRIRRFKIADLPSNFSDGEVFADGLRNEVGLAFDSRNRLWGVENGADKLNRSDLGGDIHNDNPAEELNLFDGKVGTFYGYPYCWTEFVLDSKFGKGPGTQWAWPDFINTTVNGSIINDDWCRNKGNNRPPELALPAHSAPLDITYYDGSNCDADNAFPCDLKGDAFVALHGSWNRDVPFGYKVIRIKYDKDGMPTNEIGDVFGHANVTECISNSDRAKCIRPVNAIFRKGIMYVSSDATGEVYEVTRKSGTDGDLPTHAETGDASRNPASPAMLVLCGVLLSGLLLL